MSRSGRVTTRRLAQFIEPIPSKALICRINSLRRKVSFTQVLKWIAQQRKG